MFDLAPASAYFPTGQVIVPLQAAVESPCIDPYFPAAHEVQDD